MNEIAATRKWKKGGAVEVKGRRGRIVGFAEYVPVAMIKWRDGSYSSVDMADLQYPYASPRSG